MVCYGIFWSGQLRKGEHEKKKTGGNFRVFPIIWEPGTGYLHDHAFLMLGDSGVADLEWRTISSKTYRPRKSSRLDWLPIGLSKSKAINLELILFNWKNIIYIFQLHRN